MQALLHNGPETGYVQTVMSVGRMIARQAREGVCSRKVRAP
jgi:hypothetical protein